MTIPVRSKHQQHRTDAAINRLAGLMPYGHMHASMDAAGFIDSVSDELERVRECARLAIERLDRYEDQPHNDDLKKMLEYEAGQENQISGTSPQSLHRKEA